MRLVNMHPACATAVAVVILAITGTAHAQCVGDCNNDGQVTVDEIITGVVIGLGTGDVESCLAFDSNADGLVTVDEIVTAVNNALGGCPADCGDCNDDDACTADRCESGECVHDPVVCPDDGEECTAEFCDPLTGCSSSNVDDGTVCDSGGGSCQTGVCVAFACVEPGDCDDGNACTVNSCVDNSCVSSNADDGTSCDVSGGTCQSGVCVPPVGIEYQQDFESLDAMDSGAFAADGWVVFGNVFDGVTGAYRYGYGVFPAPNGGPAFSAIDSGQGGPLQGEQQLSIYNDYNNMDHANGHQIESNVFRERRIIAEDVGKTLVFGFDAKRGNINDPADPLCPCTSTAAAFIKTLNPAAGFATTNLIQADTTAIPAAWNRYTVMLAIDSGLVGQLLQVGFSTTATLYQPSGVLYDNLNVRSVATSP